jgi:hypothetical protein
MMEKEQNLWHRDGRDFPGKIQGSFLIDTDLGLKKFVKKFLSANRDLSVFPIKGWLGFPSLMFRKIKGGWLTPVSIISLLKGK